MACDISPVPMFISNLAGQYIPSSEIDCELNSTVALHVKRGRTKIEGI